VDIKDTYVDSRAVKTMPFSNATDEEWHVWLTHSDGMDCVGCDLAPIPGRLALYNSVYGEAK